MWESVRACTANIGQLPEGWLLSVNIYFIFQTISFKRIHSYGNLKFTLEGLVQMSKVSKLEFKREGKRAFSLLIKTLMA